MCRTGILKRMGIGQRTDAYKIGNGSPPDDHRMRRDPERMMMEFYTAKARGRKGER